MSHFTAFHLKIQEFQGAESPDRKVNYLRLRLLNHDFSLRPDVEVGEFNLHVIWENTQ